MSTIKVNEVQPTVVGGGVKIDGQQMPTAGALSNRNILINGDCRIAQRTTASQTQTAGGSVFGVDRFYAFASAASKVTVQQNQGSVTPPPGFQKYLGITSSGTFTPPAGNIFSFGQAVEANNAGQLAWGTADAKAVTLSFWVRSSLTGTFGGAFLKQGFNRSYPYSYTINSANTWEYKTITIPGDTDTSISYNMSGNGLFGYFIWDYGTGDNRRGTAGAWASTHTEGATGANRLVSTSGATWYITGMQLEVGTKSTAFEHRNYADELQRCLRYTYVLGSQNPTDNFERFDMGICNSSTGTRVFIKHPVVMRTAPTVSTPDATQFQVSDTSNGFDASALSRQGSTNGPLHTSLQITHASGTTASRPYIFERNDSTSGRITFSAEL